MTGAGGRPKALRPAGAGRDSYIRLDCSLQQDDQQNDDQEQGSETYVHSLTPPYEGFHTQGGAGENGRGPLLSARAQRRRRAL